MATNKHFLQDRTALLLVSTNAFLALLGVVMILLKLNGGQGTINYIVSYRSSLGLSHYALGTARDIGVFALAAVLVFAIGLILAYRSYNVKRELSLVVLSLTVPLLVYLIVVSYSLLMLR